MKRLHILFPMAGDGIRFGGTFKPFLDATEKKFIELAKEPFNSLKDYFDIVFIFIYRQDQENEYNVKEKLHKLFPNDTIQCCILPRKTIGPVDTIQQAIQMLDIKGLCFTCDCDHSINITPMINYLLEHKNNFPDVIIPTWKYKDEDAKDFGKMKIDLSGNILSFVEKEIISSCDTFTVLGILGCYFWKNIETIVKYKECENFSNIFSFFPKEKLVPIQIQDAIFFGIPEKLEELRLTQAKQMTFFIDIDGTLIHQAKSIHYEPNEIQVIPGTIEKLQQWKKNGHRIILTTGRETPRKQRLESMLKTLNIPYDELITGCTSGTRILINDRKPYFPIHQMAIAFQLQRNKGIAQIDIEPTPDIVHILKGASFATVYLIKNQNNKLIVRKYIEKNEQSSQFVDNLKGQCENLKRFGTMLPSSVPTILTEYESNTEYYYDLQYLENYIQLSNVDLHTISRTLPTILQQLKSNIYCYNKKVDGREWVHHYLNQRIYPRLEFIETINPIFASLVNSNSIKINDIEVKGLRYYFSPEYLHLFESIQISPIHGDLTLENIMYNITTKDFKFIDLGGSRCFEPFQLDIGKLFQSLLANYEKWDMLDNLMVENNGIFFIPQEFLELNPKDYDFILNEFTDFESDKQKLFHQSIFFLATHLIRLIPYIVNKSKDKCMFALLLSLVYLYKIN